MNLTYKKIDSIERLSLDNQNVLIELIYETDPFIYPGITDNLIDFKALFLRLLQTPGPFWIGNFVLAFAEGSLVGLTLLFDSKTPSFHGSIDDLPPTNFLQVNAAAIAPILDNGLQPGTIYINNLCIKKECRGRGAARLLLQHVFSLYPHAQFELLCLKDNAPACHLYEALGFQKIRDEIGFGHEKDGGPVPVIKMIRPVH